jgi:hypothetical protein
MSGKLTWSSLGFILCLSTPLLGAVRYVATEICIYGGTSGGIVAAVAAKRAGREVLLLEPTRHLGGTTTGGLGRTDVGIFPTCIGGMAAEFYSRVEAKYGSGSVTYGFEPKVATAVFGEMLSVAGVQPMLEQQLVAVRKNGPSITEVEFASGLVVQAKQFLDTTYEGDLMAAAGVTFRTARESSAEYGESLAGITNPSPGAGFGGYAIDPYQTPGDATSGLLPGILNEPLGTPGAANATIQAYNFRLCLVPIATGQPLAQPPNYRAADYELLGRYVAARVAAGASLTLGGLTDGLLHNNTLKNGKTDWNANTGMSTDWWGNANEWATASPSRRVEIAKEHENYIRGLWHFIRTDPRIPASIKAEQAGWGLPNDEFASTAGWPPQLYVREARRMVSDVVLTQQHGLGQTAAPFPVSLAVYALDSHACRCVLVGGRPTLEGGFFQLPKKPWGIPLEALAAKASEAANLSVPFALSATHAAFASARMEPVFMSSSHAAAVAACQALEENQSLAAISRPALQTRLEAQGQVIDWTGGFTSEGIVVEAEGPGAARSGSWTVGSNAGLHGTSYLTDGNTGKGTKTYEFSPRLPVAGNYRVSMWWVSNANRATNIPVTITHASGTAAVSVNQTLDPDGNTSPGGWKDLGTYAFAAGVEPAVAMATTGTSGFVIADAVRFEPIGLSLRSTVSIVPLDASAQEGKAGDTLRFVIRRTGPTTTNLPISLTYSGSATMGADTSNLAASFNLVAGTSQLTFTATPTTDTQLEGCETLQITLQANAAYDLGASSIQCKILDTPLDQWRLQNQTGPLANDDDGDNLSNVLEFHLGTDPKASNSPPWDLENGRMVLHRALRLGNGNISIEASENLSSGSWQTVTTALADSSLAGERLTERYTLPTMANGSRRFFRFRFD